MQSQTEDQYPLTQRLALLREIMQHRDLTAIAKNLCWLLLIERMNSTTGKCFCSNTHIAKKLGIGLASVKRAKLELQTEKILEIDRQAQNEPSPHNGQAQNEPTPKSSISYYRFLRRLGAQNEPSNAPKRAELKMSPAQNEPRTRQQQKHREPVETLTIKTDGPEAHILRQAGIFIPDSRTSRFHFKTNSRAAEILRAHRPITTAPPVIDTPSDDVAQFQQWKTAFRAFPTDA